MRSKKLSKKIMMGVAALGVSAVVVTNANASQPGFYLGGLLGWGKVHEENISRGDMNAVTSSAIKSNNFTTNSFKNSGVDSGAAGRLFAGYQFNENWAAEMGWSKFRNMTTNASLSGIDKVSGLPYQSTASGTLKTDAFDLVAKGIYPITNNINVYGKLGVAYLMQRANASVHVSETAKRGSVPVNALSKSGSGSNNEHKIYPTFGVGATYEFTQNVAADLSWNRIQKTGGSKSMASTDLVGVGLIYSIG